MIYNIFFCVTSRGNSHYFLVGTADSLEVAELAVSVLLGYPVTVPDSVMWSVQKAENITIYVERTKFLSKENMQALAANIGA